MRIANSNVALASQRSYTEQGRQSIRSASRNIAGRVSQGLLTKNEVNESWGDMLALSTDEDGGGAGISETYDRNHGVHRLGKTAADELFVDFASLRNSLLQRIMERFAGIGLNLSGGAEGLSANVNNIYRSVSEMSYYEEEYTSFSAKGMALTEDGRQIDFDVSLEMSRSFALYTQTQIPMVPSALFDPLVVNVGNGVAELSEQKFKFDLDEDGIEEEISMPTGGSAFLAFDKNGDGVINDGGELFGTQSGDGFKDLAAYDEDGNGWIDENDGIFDKLRVWYKNGDGEDELIDLREADIGAIYLGEQSTTFELKGSDASTEGVIRSTGIFLHESTGLAGTIQHVDLAVGSKGAVDSGTATYAVQDGDVVAVADDVSGTSMDRAASYSTSGTDGDKDAGTRKDDDAVSEAQRRRERRLKKKAENEARLERRRAEKEKMEELYEKQVERRVASRERYEERREERLEKEEEWNERLEEAAAAKRRDKQTAEGAKSGGKEATERMEATWRFKNDGGRMKERPVESEEEIGVMLAV